MLLSKHRMNSVSNKDLSGKKPSCLMNKQSKILVQCMTDYLPATLCLSNSAQGDNYHVLCVVDVVSSRVFWWQLKSTLVKLKRVDIYLKLVKIINLWNLVYPNVIYMSSDDLLIWRNFQFWIFFLFFLTEKINLLTNQNLFFSV